MKTQNGGQIADPGFYLSLRRKELLNLEESQKLPGTGKDRFIQVSPALMLILGPVIGLFYVMFLPFISMFMVATILSRKVWTKVIGTQKKVVHQELAEARPQAGPATPNIEIVVRELNKNAGPGQFESHL